MHILQVIVTGATRGLGLRTATHMAEMQAKTILAVRDTEKGAATKQGIIDELQKKGVTVDPSNIEVTRRSESSSSMFLYTHNNMLCLICDRAAHTAMRLQLLFCISCQFYYKHRKHQRNAA
jgi:NAD(P)-dependent dehydrogenase (short-subunit alcohol dehydrogenase family)